ncbi:MAG: glycoside hydrolase family 25 protein [Crocinitomicaceae bacterium]|nr:glycoside hydrolase family 25 protein [Crocinitomicaceae bacterium]
MKRVAKGVFIIFGILTVYLIWTVLNEATKNTKYGSFGSIVPEDYPIMGIDVSRYQGEINWNLVRDMRSGDDSIQFVFIKATEGVSLEDPMKRTNAYGARGADIDYGFYHFYIPSLPAWKQAQFFCEEIGGYNFDLKPVIDIEADTDMSGDDLRDSVRVFLNFVENRLGVRPIIYTYSKMYESKLRMLPELFWIAKYSRECRAMEEDEEVICWQFSESGTVDGIAEKVDLNVAKENFFELISR